MTADTDARVAPPAPAEGDATHPDGWRVAPDAPLRPPRARGSSWRGHP